MFQTVPILSLVIFLPLVGALAILLTRGEEAIVARNARNMALWTSTVTFALSLLIWFGFERGTAEFQFVEKAAWMPSFGIGYHVGIDGISMPFVLLSTLLTPLLRGCQLGCHPEAREGVHDRLPGPRDHDGGPVLRARPRGFLPGSSRPC